MYIYTYIHTYMYIYIYIYIYMYISILRGLLRNLKLVFARGGGVLAVDFEGRYTLTEPLHNHRARHQRRL